MTDFTGWLGIGAGICTGISLVPQLYKIIATKKAENISYFMLAILITGLAGWIWYGLRKSDWPIVFTNAFAVLVNLLTIVFSVKYKNKKSNS